MQTTPNFTEHSKGLNDLKLYFHMSVSVRLMNTNLHFWRICGFGKSKEPLLKCNIELFLLVSAGAGDVKHQGWIIYWCFFIVGKNLTMPLLYYLFYKNKNKCISLQFIHNAKMKMPKLGSCHVCWDWPLSVTVPVSIEETHLSFRNMALLGKPVPTQPLSGLVFPA